MGKIEYNVDSFANAIVYAQRFNTNASAVKSQAEGILSGINPPDGLEISSEIAQIRDQLNNYSTRASEIVASLNSIKGQIEAMDASAAAQIAYMINNNVESVNFLESLPDGSGAIISYDDLPWNEKFKLWAKETWDNFCDTARTGAIAVTDGVMSYVVVPFGYGISAGITSGAQKLGFIDEEDLKKMDNRNYNFWSFMLENPYTQKYTDGTGKEHYTSYMVDDSLISPDGKVYGGVKVASGIIPNIYIRNTPGVGEVYAGISEMGYAGMKFHSQGYEANSDTATYVLAMGGKGAVMNIADRNVLGNIPINKGAMGAMGNIAISGATQAIEMPFDVWLQHATYNNTKMGTDLNGNPVTVPKGIDEVWNENGGFGAWGIQVGSAMAFTAGGEAISAVAHAMKSTNPKITSPKIYDSNSQVDIARDFGDSKQYLYCLGNDKIRNNEIDKTKINYIYDGGVCDINERQLYEDLEPYMTPEQIKDYKNIKSHNNINNYTPDEQEAVADYTYSVGYTLNKGIREGGNYEGSPYVQNLDSAINKSKVPNDIVTYRAADGVFDNNTQIDVSNLKPGDTFSDPAYMSTSVIKERAHGGKDILLEIEVPEGTNALYAEQMAGVSNYGQQELLFGRNTQLEVVEPARVETITNNYTKKDRDIVVIKCKVKN